ncbi:unnamed protein product [Mytilus coruscus]|uniref:Nephrocystin 3-like N-terminal domain-containing protein n=1 Tax=Mytilus coruscus TaxID=42192 RepID=A0A6J8BLE6_MYTCO|nr:unnamed protein product [Mytilus coruscus]
MAHIGEIVNKEKLDNYISVLLGLRFMVSGLQEFVKSRLELKKLEIQPKCTTGCCQLNCSRKFGCLSMRFKDDWNLDSFVDFNFYVENLHNQSIVSKTWLIGKIYEELATSEKGIILTAEMGYGKSSVVSNLVCAEKSSDWYAIRKNVLVYHFCRYDSIRSTKAAYFIRNIASAVIHRYPELGTSILSDDIANDILYGPRCSEDTISCLDIAIFNPLRNKWKNYQFIIVVDALDECNSGDKTDISQLLFKQIDNFPPNINLFEELMPIFEILCTMTKPMTKEKILEVANISSLQRQKIERVIGNELGHFLMFTDRYLSFSHKSIADFLTCESRKHLRFFVCKENGHNLFGAYLLNSLNISKFDLVDLVHHVAMSRNEELQNMLLHSNAKQLPNDTNMPFLFYLYQAARDFNSYTTISLLLKMTNLKHINDKDERNMAVAVIAASHGNENALKCLLDYGADPYSKVFFFLMKATDL